VFIIFYFRQIACKRSRHGQVKYRACTTRCVINVMVETYISTTVIYFIRVLFFWSAGFDVRCYFYFDSQTKIWLVYLHKRSHKLWLCRVVTSCSHAQVGWLRIVMHTSWVTSCIYLYDYEQCTMLMCIMYKRRFWQEIYFIFIFGGGSPCTLCVY
jgi:hypothetical protein